MNRPNDAEIFETPLAFYWLDKDGICNIETKPAPRTLENSKASMESFKKTFGGKKVYCIADLTYIKEVPEESRVYYQKETPTIFNAIAYVTQSELSRMVATVFSLIFNPLIPTKIFSNEADARAWLKDLKEKGASKISPTTDEKKVKGKLLLVDDNPAEEIIMNGAIKEGNWDISLVFFSKPKKALEYLKESNDEIFLIISDINMPGMNGFDFKKAIDADEDLARKSIPFIFFSNSVRKEDVIQAYDNRIQGYFQKPPGLTEAIALLDKIFNYWLISNHPAKVH